MNGKQVTKGQIEASLPVFISSDETYDAGTDTDSPAGDYPAHFDFEGPTDWIVLRSQD